MALLLRYEEFLDVLRDASHPDAWIPACTFESYDPEDDRFNLERSEDYSSIRNHLFICRVEQALEKASVDKPTFQNWCKCARDAFLSRNIPGIPVGKFALYGGKGSDICMDPRCFVDHFDALASVTQSTHVIVQHLHHQLNDVVEILREDERSMRSHLLDMMSSVRRLEQHIRPATLLMCRQTNLGSATAEHGAAPIPPGSNASDHVPLSTDPVSRTLNLKSAALHETRPPVRRCLFHLHLRILHGHLHSVPTDHSLTKD